MWLGSWRRMASCVTRAYSLARTPWKALLSSSVRLAGEWPRALVNSDAFRNPALVSDLDGIVRHASVLLGENSLEGALVVIGQAGRGMAPRLGELGRFQESRAGFSQFQVALEKAFLRPRVAAPAQLVVGEVTDQPRVLGEGGAEPLGQAVGRVVKLQI